MLAAAQAEGLKPSPENLPDTGMIMRIRTDANTGGKFNEFYGKRSFIADMGREGRRVACIRNPHDNSVLWGQPLQQAR